MNITPVITKDLIEYLKRLFPKHDVAPESSMQEIYYNAGIYRVINTLEAVREKQEAKK